MGIVASSEPKSNEDDIGSALLVKVRSFHEENAEKITGMLLEMPQKDLQASLEDDSKLMSQIYEAIKILDYEKELEKHESLGDVLYQQVEMVYSKHDIAEKITGMLLEMNVAEIERLIQDKNELLVKIHEAFEVLESHKNKEHRSQTMDKRLPSKTELGEQVFEHMLQWYPDEEIAAKLTGMLLEMNIEEIKKLTQENELLRCKAKEAYQALQTTQK